MEISNKPKNEHLGQKLGQPGPKTGTLDGQTGIVGSWFLKKKLCGYNMSKEISNPKCGGV